MRLPLFAGSDSPEPTYVYARRSRRAGGLCLGLDLAPNRGCNWGCVYCDTVEQQAEGPEIDQEQLERELGLALDRMGTADFADGEGPRAVLVSGSGEPTHCYDLPKSVETLAKVLGERGLAGQIPTILVTNGERISERRSRAAIETLSGLDGQVWYKLDTATREGLKELNATGTILRAVRNNLRVAAENLPTWLQTCVFNLDGAPSLDEEGRAAYVALVKSQLSAKVPIRGVQLYAPHRPAPGDRISAPDEGWVRELEQELSAHLPVQTWL